MKFALFHLEIKSFTSPFVPYVGLLMESGLDQWLRVETRD